MRRTALNNPFILPRRGSIPYVRTQDGVLRPSASPGPERIVVTRACDSTQESRTARSLRERAQGPQCSDFLHPRGTVVHANRQPVALGAG
eukprot:7389917-Prymnesium_polylepis.3